MVLSFPESADAPRALWLAGQCYEELVQWGKTVDVYRKIITEYPNSKQAEAAQLLLGHAYRADGKHTKAIAAYDVIREGGLGRYPVSIVIEAVLHMGETQSLMGKHRDAATSYLRVFYLYKEHDPLSALIATARAGDVFAKADQLRNARDEYQKAITFYESQSSGIQDSANKKEWDKLDDLQLLELFKNGCFQWGSPTVPVSSCVKREAYMDDSPRSRTGCGGANL